MCPQQLGTRTCPLQLSTRSCPQQKVPHGNSQPNQSLIGLDWLACGECHIQWLWIVFTQDKYPLSVNSMSAPAKPQSSCARCGARERQQSNTLKYNIWLFRQLDPTSKLRGESNPGESICIPQVLYPPNIIPFSVCDHWSQNERIQWELAGS